MSYFALITLVSARLCFRSAVGIEGGMEGGKISKERVKKRVGREGGKW